MKTECGDLGEGKFGKGRFGRGLYGRGEVIDEVAINRTLQGIMQRYPRGFAWRGENLLALSRAFAKEFTFLKLDAMKEAHQIEFLEEFAKKESGNLSLPFIESVINRRIFGIGREEPRKAYLFYSTGLREYVPPFSASHTYFGAPNARFNAGWTTDSQMLHRAQFGENVLTSINPRSFAHAQKMNGGEIDFLLNRVELIDTSENAEKSEEVKVWEMIDNNRSIWRFVYFVGGKAPEKDGDEDDEDECDEFLFPLNFESEEQYLEFRRLLLELVPFGMFGIINKTIKPRVDCVDAVDTIEE